MKYTPSHINREKNLLELYRTFSGNGAKNWLSKTQEKV